MIQWGASHAVNSTYLSVCVHELTHKYRIVTADLLILITFLTSPYLFTRGAPCNYFKVYRNVVPSRLVLRNVGVEAQKTYVTSLLLDQSNLSPSQQFLCLFSVLYVTLCQMLGSVV